VSTADAKTPLVPDLSGRLGYLFKHAHARLLDLTAEALHPHGITGRELAVLIVLAGCGPASQQAAAEQLRVDRTTMVGFVDGLAAKGLVTRQPDPADRRRNIVVLTPAGEDTLRRARHASDEAERRFLAPLTGAAADQFRQALRDLATGE
jgi:DNA-binding MarR family transcriptional regulator